MAEAVRVLPLHRSLSIFSSSSLLISSSASTLSSLQPGLPPNHNLVKKIYNLPCSSSSDPRGSALSFPRKQLLSSFKVHATVAETNQPKWWEKNAPNMIDVHSTEEFLCALSEAGDRLVIAEFYGTWCASCRALFPKLCKTADEHPEILFLKVNFDENKPMCKSLNVRVLPCFHFYRGAHGQLDQFSCSLAKFQKIKDAIELHNRACCSLEQTKGVADLSLEIVSTPIDKTDGTT